MFGKANGSGATTTGRRAGLSSIIGADATVTGDVAAASDLHVDGTIIGDVTCAALAQGPSSRIVGTVRGTSARIAGIVEGAVEVEQLTVCASARIAGDVTYDSIAMETGARIDGRMKHRAETPPAPPLRLTDSTDAPA